MLVAFGVTVLLWVAAGPVRDRRPGADSAFARAYATAVPEGVAAMLGALLLFVLPIDWRAAPLHADVGRGGADRLGHRAALRRRAGDGRPGVLDRAGRGAWARASRRGCRRTRRFALTALFTAAAIVLSEATSNTASANMIVPVAIAVAQAAGVRPLEPALGATLGASMGFMMPISTAPNAIVYSSGYIPITAMMRYGLALDLVGFVLIVAAVTLAGPLLF